VTCAVPSVEGAIAAEAAETGTERLAVGCLGTWIASSKASGLGRLPYLRSVAVTEKAIGYLENAEIANENSRVYRRVSGKESTVQILHENRCNYVHVGIDHSRSHDTSRVSANAYDHLAVGRVKARHSSVAAIGRGRW
jgi:hypothetical protein